MSQEAIPPPSAALRVDDPVMLFVEQGRDVPLVGTWPALGSLGAQAVVGPPIAGVGLSWRARTRKAFADVV